MVGDVDYSDAAVTKATGKDWAQWLSIVDGYGNVDHTTRAKMLATDHPEIGGWWAQMVTVEYERRRGLREVGQSSKGDYQVSCSKAAPWDANECFERLVSTPFLPGADWTEGATWETDGGKVEVRIVAPGKQLRWFWFDEAGKSTVVADFWPNAKGDKMNIVFSHSGLSSQEAREFYRAKWKAALAMISE